MICPDCRGARCHPPCRGCGGSGVASCCEGAVGGCDEVPRPAEDYNPELDSWRSWEAWIAVLRERYLAGKK